MAPLAALLEAVALFSVSSSGSLRLLLFMPVSDSRTLLRGHKSLARKFKGPLNGSSTQVPSLKAQRGVQVDEPRQ